MAVVVFDGHDDLLAGGVCGQDDLSDLRRRQIVQLDGSVAVSTAIDPWSRGKMINVRVFGPGDIGNRQHSVPCGIETRNPLSGSRRWLSAPRQGNSRRRVRRVADHRHAAGDRKSTRLNSSHLVISYAVFCLKKKKKKKISKKINKKKKKRNIIKYKTTVIINR